MADKLKKIVPLFDKFYTMMGYLDSAKDALEWANGMMVRARRDC